MQTAASARSDTNDSLSGLTYLDTLVTAATTKGLSSISVEPKLINDSMISSLESLGYTVKRLSLDNMTFAPFIITW